MSGHRPTPPSILFEDGELLAVNKPEGLSAIPERDLAVACAQRLLEAARGEKLFAVHRLDKEVSGLLLFAKNADAHRRLSIAFERREVDKRYLALAWGVPEARSGEMAAPIREFGSGRMGVDARGKPSLTRWRLLGEGALRGQPVALLELSPHTGRRHQLRVHAYAMGHPLVGDPSYGPKELQVLEPRLAQHALAIALSLSGNDHALMAPPPPSFVLHAGAAGLEAALERQVQGALGSKPKPASS